MPEIFASELAFWRLDTKHNDVQDNDNQHNGTKHNDTQRKVIQQ